MGVVYRARDERLQVTRALKFVHAEAVGDPTVRARLLREARAGASPPVAPCDRPGDRGGRVRGPAVPAMEYIEGTSLQQRLEAGPLTVCEAVLVAIEVAEGWRRPTPRGSSTATSSQGTSSAVGTGRPGSSTSASRAPATTLLTASGALVGTLPYMSPSSRHRRCRPPLRPLGARRHPLRDGQRPPPLSAPPSARAWSRPSAAAPAALPGPALPRSAAAAGRDRRARAGQGPAAAPRQRRRAAARPAGRAARSAAHGLGDHGRRRSAGAAPLAGAAPAGSAPGLAAGAGGRGAGRRGGRLAAAAGGAGGGADDLPGVQRRLTWEPGWEGDPCLSPDGTRIAFASDESGNRDLWIISVSPGASGCR